jgi:3-dehydroquinate dehydratase-1
MRHPTELGNFPLVIGTIITADFLQKWSENPHPLPCDLVELRVDGFADFPNWLEVGKKIEKGGFPVITTIRLMREGGKWREADEDRWPLLEQAIHELTGVDVELESELAARVCAKCAEVGKISIVSYHDFEKTPSFIEMQNILQRAQKLGRIAKIAARADNQEDVARLRKLLQQTWSAPICVIGMGSLGRETRLNFPLAGSCFTYGYLDLAGAPGQYSAEELSRHIEAHRAAPRA